MTEAAEKDCLYVYQPWGSIGNLNPDDPERMFAIGGLPPGMTVKGLKKDEVVLALKAMSNLLLVEYRYPTGRMIMTTFEVWVAAEGKPEKCQKYDAENPKHAAQLFARDWGEWDEKTALPQSLSIAVLEYKSEDSPYLCRVERRMTPEFIPFDA